MRALKACCVGCGLVLCLAMTARAGSSADLFSEANARYAAGDYAAAATLYEELAAQGVRSGALYYNLAGAYFKSGKKGKAIVNYERAKKFIARDEDLRHNIHYVDTLLVETQPQEARTAFGRLWAGTSGALSPRGWFTLGLIFYWGLCLLGVGAFWIRSLRASVWVWSLLLGGVVVLSLAVYGRSVLSEGRAPLAVVTAPSSEVRYSPSYDGAVAFELHEGIRVRVLRSMGAWCQVRLTKDKSGYIESSAIEKV